MPQLAVRFANMMCTLVWFNEWGKEVIADIWYSADEEMKKALVWPAEVVGVISKKFHPPDCGTSLAPPPPQKNFFSPHTHSRDSSR